MKPANRKKPRRTHRPTFPNSTRPRSRSSTASHRSSPGDPISMPMAESSSGIARNRVWALNRAVVLGYRLQLEAKKLAASTINVRLAAVRRLAYEAADTGLVSPELVAGIRRVKGVPQLGRRVGNWLSAAEGEQLLSGSNAETLRQKRDAAIISLLLGCGLRRSEVIALAVGDIQKREDHWAIVDLVGKAGHVRTVPVPDWVKKAVDRWTESASIPNGRLFRSIRKNGTVWGRRGHPECRLVRGEGQRGSRRNQEIGTPRPRRTCARLCHAAGGELEQIQFLLGQASVQTTERYIGCKQELSRAVNDRLPFAAGRA